jgi:PAS domain S-box-containing protein
LSTLRRNHPGLPGISPVRFRVGRDFARHAAYAIALIVAAVSCRVLLQGSAPDIGDFALLLPAVMFAAVLWGTVPGLAAAIAGALAVSVLLLGLPGLLRPAVTAPQVALLAFIAASAAVLRAARIMRRTVLEAQAAEARLAEVFRQFPGTAAILAAPEGRLLLRSEGSRAVLGHDDHQLSTAEEMAAYGAVHDDGRPYAADEYPIVRALKTGEVIRAERMRYVRPDRTAVELEVFAGPVRGEAGDIVASVGMAFDVTERLAAERRLLASEAECRATAERLRAAIEAGALGLWECDLRSYDLSIDAAMAAMLGMPAAPAILSARELQAMFHPEDRGTANRALAAAIEGGRIYADESRLRGRDGRYRTLISRGTVIPHLGKAIGVVSDVTERREREDALKAALHARDVLMREADHRIKNSLQLVASLLRLQMGRTDNPEISAALGEAIARVDAVGNAHLALQGSPDLRSIEIDQMVSELCARVGSLNPAIALRCDASSGLMVDAEQAIPLGLITSELLTNALRHAYPPGSPGAIAVAVRRRADGLELAVADGGRGMAPACAPGLGSTVIRMLTRQIGAEARTVSAPGQGTSVTLTMRLKDAQDAPDEPKRGGGLAEGGASTPCLGNRAAPHT